MAGPWDDYAAAPAPAGAPQAGPWTEYQAPAADAGPPPVPVKLGQAGFKDAMMQTLQDQPWLARNAASMGLQLSKAWQGLTGGGDQAQIQGADVAAKEAPVGAMAGDVAKYAPAMLAGGVLAPAAIVAGIAGATTPGGVGERATAAGVEGGTALGVGLAAKGVAAGAKYLGNMGSLAKARAVLEDIIGPNNMPEALRLAKAAPADVSAEQALVGLNNPNVANLARITHGLSPEAAATHADLMARQQAGRVAAMEGVAGAGNQTAARDTATAMKDAVSSVTGPAREVELAAANTAGTTGRQLQSEADRLAGAATNKVEDVRRISGAQQKADELAQAGYGRLDVSTPGNPPAMGLPRLGGQYSYPAELSNVAERGAQNAADTSLTLGDAGRFAQSRADSLAAHGLQPLDTNRMVSILESKLQDPTIGPSDINTRVLSNVADKIKEWTAKNGGVIDANALYTIRKSAVGDTVETLLGASDPKTKAKRAAQLLSEVNPMIDNAIIKAGGTGWKDYLAAHSAGMHAVEQQQLGAKAFDLLKNSPNKFVDLVNGNAPKTVEKVFGSGRYDISKEMGAADLATMRGVSSEVARDATLAAQRSSEGSAKAVLDKLQVKGLASLIPNILYRPAMIAHAGLKEGEMAANRAMMAHLGTAMRDPQKLSALLETLPIEQRNLAVRYLSRFANSGAPAVAGGTMADLVRQ